MTDDPSNQHDPASPPAPSGLPQPKCSRSQRKIFIAGVVIALIVFVVIALPWIVVVFQWISALIFGPSGNCECSRVVAATAQQPDNGTIVITYQGGQDAGIVVGITATVTESTGHEQSKTVGNKKRPIIWTDYLWFWDLIFPPHEREPPTFSELPVGQNITFNGEFTGKDHVTANVHFEDQTEMVILDMNI